MFDHVDHCIPCLPYIILALALSPCWSICLGVAGAGPALIQLVQGTVLSVLSLI